MDKTAKDIDIEEARALMCRLSDSLCDELAAISRDDDDATKMARAAAIIDKTTPEVTALVVLGLFASLREYEDRFTVYDSLLAKVARGALKDFDS